MGICLFFLPNFPGVMFIQKGVRLFQTLEWEESGRNDVMRLLSNMIWVIGFITNIRLPEKLEEVKLENKIRTQYNGQ